MKSLAPSLNHNFFIFLIAVLLCYAFSSYVRFEQYQAWEQKPNQYSVGNQPMMTTLDSYFWLRLAKEYNAGGIPEGRDQLRNFPDGKRSQHPVPGISYLIAKVAPSFDNNYYRAGFFLMIGLSGAFIFPLAYYFFLIGYPIAGILGGLFGTVSYEYFIRTGIGRVDTDALMLFFPFLIAVLVFQAAQARKLLNVLIYSCIGGGVTYLLTLWWGKSAYVLPFSAVLFLTLILHRISQTHTSEDEAKQGFKIRQKPFLNSLLIGFIAAVMFFVCAIGFKFADLSRMNFSDIVFRYLGEYIQPESQIGIAKTSSIAFPDVLETVTETEQFPIQESLGRLLTSPTLSAIGLIGFLIFFFTHWKKLIPILPIFVIGLLAFQGARRFGMFLGPFVGVGYGFLLTIFAGWILQRIRENLGRRHNFPALALGGRTEITPDRVKEIVVYGLAAVLFFSVMASTGNGRVPRPSIPAPIFRTFLDLKDTLPADSAIYTWWDYGYALTEVTDQATFHDGGAQTSPKTFFVARSFISDNPDELYNTISYLTGEGAGGIYRMIEANAPSEELFANVLVTPPTLHHNNVFIVYTNDLIKKYRAISLIGGWDVEKKRFGRGAGYDTLKCDRLEEHEIRCQEGTIDLKTGLATIGIAIKETVIIDGGYVKRRITYSNDHGSYLQILTNGRTLVGAHIVGESVYRSNFNQMYLLGQYDSNLFKEYYNSFPWTRVFHVRTQPYTEQSQEAETETETN